jgi:hypothetical protein
MPTFDVVRSDVEGFMEELWEFQAAFHDCFARSEPRVHFFDLAGCKFSVAQTRLTRAKGEGNSESRAGCSQKNGGYFGQERGRECA